MIEVNTINEVLDQFRKAKIKAGDFRGFKNKFELAAKFELNPMEVYYNSCNHPDKIEVYADIMEDLGENYHDRGRCYLLSELREFFASEPMGKYSISFYVLNWGKQGLDERLFEILFHKYN